MRILTVDKGPDLRRRLQSLFGDGEVQVGWERSTDRVLDRFEAETFDILLIASPAIREGGMEVLEVLAARCPMTQVVFLLEPRHMGLLRPALQAGTYQYARMPAGDEELKALLEAAWDRRPQVGVNQLLKGDTEGFADMVGQSAAMRDVYRSVRQAAATDIAVLILGETGTGKDLVSRAIHELSARSGGPYVQINAGAIPPELVASELFGYEKGAFTGASERRPGRFEQGDGGTVFLDEIGTVDERVQISLLRLLEEHTFYRLGGTDLVRCDVRLLAASNSDLASLVAEGRFRDDLYYRLDVFRISLPPLRERHGDIPLLVANFIQRYDRDYQKRVRGTTPECTALLESHSWPGNVRELRNIIQRAVLLCSGDTIAPDHLPHRLRTAPRPDAETVTFPIGSTLQEVEKEMVVRTLRTANNNRARAARMLGISRRALYNKLERHGIE